MQHTYVLLTVQELSDVTGQVAGKGDDLGMTLSTERSELLLTERVRRLREAL